MVDQPTILGIDGQPIGRKVVPLAIAFGCGYKPGLVLFQTAATRQPATPEEMRFLQCLVNQGLTAGYELTPDAAEDLARSLRTMAKKARKAGAQAREPISGPDTQDGGNGAVEGKDR